MKKEQVDSLVQFLSMTRDEVFDFFRKNGEGKYIQYQDFPRFLYIEGERANKALMFAHADHVWGDIRTNPVVLGNVIYSKDAEIAYKAGIQIQEMKDENIPGIGADDRVGCFIISQLMQTGNSLLITEGEEMALGPILLSQLDFIQRIVHQHAFGIEFDRGGNSDLVFYNGENEAFKSFINRYFPTYSEQKGSFSDILPICKNRIPSVNVSVGYHRAHSYAEHVLLSDVDMALKYGKNLLTVNWANVWNFD